MKRNDLLKITIICILISIIYTILVKYMDVAAIGPEQSKVGFAGMNSYFRDLIGYNKIWYTITKYLGILPFLLVAYFGLIGLKQLYDRRSLLQVDKRILLLGVFYVLLGLVYIFFEKVIINYRPFLQDGVLEASYPSSHTMLAICICSTAIYVGKFYIKNKRFLKIFNACNIALMIILVLGRLVSGVHWFSDILGGIIISTTLVFIYLTAINYWEHDKKRI
ncbi:MAG: phosphatase PAP2 family protein [Bacilli bacterium]|nr:phosphatase PAP2 family protein [Bacilli bacterium]